MECGNGADGIRATMISLFNSVLNYTKHERILVFEDDIRFLPVLGMSIKEVVNCAISEIPKDFDLMFLGGNVYKPMVYQSPFLFKLTGAVANHAVVYTRHIMEQLVTLYKLGGITDLLIDRNIIPRGKSYIVNPLLCTQYPDYSDIEKRTVNYDNLLVGRYMLEANKCK